MEVSGWGRYPRVQGEIGSPLSSRQCASHVASVSELIARGLGRSYGDSSLAHNMLDTRHLDHYLAFDSEAGLLSCAAGITLDDFLRTFVPRGWFLPVTPGTRFITIGGAIASDVHGKNHHIEGSFCDHVTRLELLLGNGERVTASLSDKPDLFHATCGGMGLTGIILSATVRLKPIRSSNIVQTTIKAPGIDAVLHAFEDNANATYSVAWIDCLARGKHLGRSLLMLGEHAEHGVLEVNDKPRIPVPVEMPASLLNPMSVKAFNMLYYHKAQRDRHVRNVSFDSFFYPLDRLIHWNRLYGKRGFLQYQFVLPKAAGISGLKQILQRISQSGQAPFLAVLKVFGKGNDNMLSFPCEGYSLALDFKAEPAIFSLLNELDKAVLDQGGRLYLTKDARMSEAMFKSSYARWAEFEAVRERYHAAGKFASGQSRRLGLQ